MTPYTSTPDPEPTAAVATSLQLAPTPPPQKRLASCLPCRERHIKCGKERPVCSSCSSAKHHRHCAYESKRALRFRLTFAQPHPQPHAPTSRSASGGTDPRSSTSTAGPPTPSNNSQHHDIGFTPSTLSVLSVLNPPDSSDPNDQQLREEALVPQSKTPSDFGPDASHSVQVFERSGRWPSLADRTECDIFAFYVRSLAHWMDIGSPNHFFQSQVPQLAMEDPLLFFACLSCSSEIMALRGELAQSVEEYYRARVLEILIPLLSSHHTTTCKESLMVTTVILRMSEQFLELENDTRRHLHGAASLFSADSPCWLLREVNLATASFWTHLRESIRVAFLHETPCDMNLRDLVSYGALTSESKVPDEVWTNHITYLLLQTIQLCWGTSKSISEFNRLASEIDRWESSVPQSFQPWCFVEEPDSPFPRILHFQSWHVVAWQFFYTAQIMLSVYREDRGPTNNMLDLMRQVEISVVTPTRKLCGLCASSTDNVGNTLNGSHLMAWAGQFLYSQEEQMLLTTFLEGFTQQTSWPTGRSLEKLKSRWELRKPSWPRLSP